VSHAMVDDAKREGVTYRSSKPAVHA
jgi:hypothetical protein